jgi:hypothetical protein
MKRDIYFSDFCGRIDASYEDWYEKAHKQVEAIMEKDDGPADLSPDLDDRLNAVLARLEEDDVTWRENSREWWRAYIRDFC